jgi:hypothetical protein
MDTFTILALIFNIFNTAIHLNTKFMVISYNQNMHFRIHCKKFQKQDYILIHDILILNNSYNNMNIKFIIEVYAFL